MDVPVKILTTVYELLAEFFGTFIILFFGNGVGGAVQSGSLVGSLQAGLAWGLAVAAAIFASAPVSGAHLNPAVTLGLASCLKFDFWKVPLYMIAQFLGALAGSSIVYSFFWSSIIEYEKTNNIIRGEPGSFISGSMFRCTLSSEVSSVQGFYIETSITAMLLVVISYLNDKNVNYGTYFPPLMIGLLVAILTAAFSPLTSACLNPARDLGPRLLTFFAGWGSSAFPGEAQNPTWPFIVGPLLGGVIGACAWEFVGSRIYTFVIEERSRLAEPKLIAGMGSKIISESAHSDIDESEKRPLVSIQ